MKYCTNCGRQLADDEVCTCRQQAQPQAPNQTQDNNAQADNAAQQGQFNGQPQGSAQGQFNGQPQGSAQGQFNGQSQGQFNGQPQGSAQSQAFDNFTQQVSAAGQQLQNDKVNIGGAELIARGHGLLLGGDDAAVDDLDGVGQRLFEGGVLALKLGDQRGELRQVSAQRNGEHANAGFGFD